jgi:hypothetical protein
MNKKIKLFLSYADEDIVRVEELYERLKAFGFEPWIAKRDIIPGERWEYAISKAARQSDFILICVSQPSAIKRGYVQKEIRDALDLWKEKLEDDIFLIPVRFDAVQIPNALAPFQWVDLFEDKGFERLCEAIRAGAFRKQSSCASATSGEINTLPIKFVESVDGPPQFSIDFEYPEFQGRDTSVLNQINARIEGFVLDQVHNFRRHRPDTIISSHHSLEKVPSNAYDLYGAHTITLLTSHLVSIRFHVGTYEAGWAHPHNWIRTFNFLLTPPIELTLGALLNQDTNYLNILSSICTSDLTKQAIDDGYEYSDTILRGAAPDAENFKEFNLTKDALIISFQDYAVGPHAWSLRQVSIPIRHLREKLSNHCTLFALLTPA